MNYLIKCDYEYRVKLAALKYAIIFEHEKKPPKQLGYLQAIIYAVTVKRNRQEIPEVFSLGG